MLIGLIILPLTTLGEVVFSMSLLLNKCLDMRLSDIKDDLGLNHEKEVPFFIVGQFGMGILFFTFGLAITIILLPIIYICRII